MAEERETLSIRLVCAAILRAMETRFRDCQSEFSNGIVNRHRHSVPVGGVN